jgi:hypothetical protein
MKYLCEIESQDIQINKTNARLILMTPDYAQNAGILFTNNASQNCLMLHEIRDGSIINPGQALIIKSTTAGTHPVSIEIDGKYYSNGSEVGLKSQIPSKLSQLENDIGAGAGTAFTVSSTAPTEPSPGDYWYKIL